MRKLVGGNEQVTKLFDAALAVLKAQGAELIDGLELPDPGEAQLDFLLFELKAAMADYLTRRRTASPHKSLKDLIAFNEKNADKEMPYFKQELFVRAEKKGPLTDPAYLKAKKACAEASKSKGIDALVKKHKLTALVGSAFGPTYNIDLLNGDPSFPGNDGYGGSPAAMAGYPSLTVPMGDAMGLPVGLLFCGPAWTEARLLSYAFAYEQASPKRRLPTFRETLALP
jgi:amidase